MAKKKAWGPSNPLWRYLHKKSSSSGSSRPSRRGGSNMARRKRSYSRRSGFGGAGSMIKQAAVGLGIAAVFPGLLGAAGAYMLAGPAAGIAAYMAPNIKNAVSGVVGNVSGSSSGGYTILG